ncbi:hypothetical protein HER39_04960 [Arthrobacter deserti]|uniref:STAS domain-containing protein n=1 Tax=Arthrobacter deserti TaxID=1742687 RepID=A0ABX1JMX0_9MICC|nr:hypothetical protein [Arthrobacter deserti]
MDLEGSSARIYVRGGVTSRNLRALYALVRRTNALAPGLDIAIDLAAAAVQPDALDALRAATAAGHLPESADPAQAGCRLRILARQPETVPLLAA